MKKNKKPMAKKGLTHGGATVVVTEDAEKLLRRTIMSCLLWENEFYEDGESIAARIRMYALSVKPERLAALAVEAREAGLRHVPLLLTVVLAKTGAAIPGLVSGTVFNVVRRADELSELVKLYWIENKDKPLSGQLKKGLAKAFTKFDEYRLAKYDRASEVRLRDVMRLVHPTPKDATQAEVFKRLAANELKTPDTWEVALSGGADKKATFERLIREGNLGYLALLRNLRGMSAAGVDRSLVIQALAAGKGADMVFPFRYIAAARACPEYAAAIDTAFTSRMAKHDKLPGTTLVVVDVSGSMHQRLSAKSDMNRMDAGGALAAIARELCQDSIIYATGGNDYSRKHKTEMVPATRGFGLVDGVVNMCRPLGGGGIFLNQCIRFIAEKHPHVKFDRVIVITDEQDCGTGSGDSPSNAPLLGRTNYILNVGSYQNGIGHGRWTTISGFSENVFRYIIESEKSQLTQ